MKDAHRTPKDTAGDAGKLRQFTGTANPRHARVLCALMHGRRTREEVDRIAGASNGPDVIAELRRRGLDIPCHRALAWDRDGNEVARGVYALSADDRRRLSDWRQPWPQDERPGVADA